MVFVDEVVTGLDWNSKSPSWISTIYPLCFIQVLMTDHGLRAALIFSPFVTFLNVSGCFTLGDSSMITIGKLRTLQHLNISGCFRLTDMGIKILCQMPPEISHLNVSKCSYLSDASLFFIGESLSDSLTVLGANHLERVTDKGIEQLTRSAVKLKQLDLRECPHVTDMSCLFLAASVLQVEKIFPSEASSLPK